MATATYRITDAATGDEFPCGAEESLFAAIIRSGKGPIRYGCAGGGCGACKVRIVRGEVRQSKPMSRRHVSAEEEESGYTLACCVTPMSDVTLEKE